MSKKARGFVLGKTFQPCLMFAGRAGAYPRVEHLSGASLNQYTLALDLARNDCEGQTHKLIRNNCKLRL